MEPSTNQINPATIKVVATTGGFKTFVAFLSAMFIFLIVFLVGIIAGVAGLSAASEDNGVVQTRVVYDGGSSTVAIFDVSGVIDESNASYAEQVVDKILDDKRVRAVVLRVDSGGGGVTASDEIWHQVQRIKNANITLIASYGSLAASGGYYISCNADYILAQETTITGSIGVIANIMTFQDLLKNIGVKPITLIADESPEKSVANDIYRNWTVKDKKQVTEFLDAMYDVFLTRVQEGRSKVITDPKELAKVANGSAYIAKDALENGLIDGLGYLDDAVSIAKAQAGLSKTNPTIVRYSRKQPMLGGLFGARSHQLTTSDLKSMIQEFSMTKLMYMYN